MRKVESLVGFGFGQRREAINAGGVIEQLSHGDFASVRGRFRYVLCHIVIEIQFTFVNELQHDGG